MGSDSWGWGPLSILVNPADILANDVKLDVHTASHLEGMEVGVLVGVGDDGHLEGIVRRVAHRQAHPVHRHRTLVHGQVSATRHLSVKRIFEGEVPASLRIVDGNALCRLVHMALHDVSVQPSVHHHRALHIHLVAHAEQPQV